MSAASSSFAYSRPPPSRPDGRRPAAPDDCAPERIESNWRPAPGASITGRRSHTARAAPQGRHLMRAGPPWQAAANRRDRRRRHQFGRLECRCRNRLKVVSVGRRRRRRRYLPALRPECENANFTGRPPADRRPARKWPRASAIIHPANRTTTFSSRRAALKVKVPPAGHKEALPASCWAHGQRPAAHE